MADAEKARRAAAGRERLVRKIDQAHDALRRRDAAAKDSFLRIDPASPPPAPLPEGRDAAAYDAAAKEAEKAQAAAERNVRMALANPKVREPGAPRHDHAATGADKRPATSFRDREAALAFSDGRVHALRRPDGEEYDPKDVIVVENPNGEALVYVNVDLDQEQCREIGGQLHGRKLMADGLHADHIASHKVEGGMKQQYVLLGRAPARVNHSYGRTERVGRRANRPFNLASRGDGVTLSNRDMDAKMNGLRPSEAQADGAVIDPNSETARHTRFADKDSQAAIRAAKGRSLAGPERASPGLERLDAGLGKRTKAPDRGRDHGKG